MTVALVTGGSSGIGLATVRRPRTASAARLETAADPDEAARAIEDCKAVRLSGPATETIMVESGVLMNARRAARLLPT